MNEIKFIDLFAGVGGFHKGLTQASVGFLQQGLEKGQWSKSIGNKRGMLYSRKFDCVWANEWDKYAATIYKKNFPKTKLFQGDIRLVKADDIPKADLLCAGFPCQSFSLAGRRKGFEEARGTLFYEICRIAKAKRIPYLLLENVKGLLSAQDKYAFTEILHCLDELGYCLQWQVLNSKNFGVPQNRERVFIVGCLGEKRFKQVFPLKQDGGIYSQAGQGERESRQGIQNQISSTIGKGYGKVRAGGETMIVYSNSQRDLMELTQNKSRGYRVYSIEGVSSTLAGNAGGVGAKTGLYAVLTPDRLNKRQNGRRFKEDGEEMFTLTGQDIHGIATENRIRRLTPIECERLQGFPDNWTEGLSDTQRYKCMGNAVTVNVIEAIGRRMIEVGLFEKEALCSLNKKLKKA
jgi:DNA (cytosine-5)-methyltransferase 1